MIIKLGSFIYMWAWNSTVETGKGLNSDAARMLMSKWHMDD